MSEMKRLNLTKKQTLHLFRIVGAGVLLLVAVILSKTGVLPGEVWYITLPVFLVPYLLVGWDVIRAAVVNLFGGQLLDEHFLMMIATVGAFVIGEYPEAVFVMLFYQVGELFQSIAVGRSRRSIAALMDIRPDVATVERNGTEVKVPPEEVEVGEVLIIRPGEKIPLDGCVIEGRSELNTVSLTGESAPRDVAAGDSVISGCVNVSGLLRVRVEKPFGESTVSKILELVENSALGKDPVQERRFSNARSAGKCGNACAETPVYPHTYRICAFSGEIVYRKDPVSRQPIDLPDFRSTCRVFVGLCDHDDRLDPVVLRNADQFIGGCQIRFRLCRRDRYKQHAEICHGWANQSRGARKDLFHDSAGTVLRRNRFAVRCACKRCLGITDSHPVADQQRALLPQISPPARRDGQTVQRLFLSPVRKQVRPDRIQQDGKQPPVASDHHAKALILHSFPSLPIFPFYYTHSAPCCQEKIFREIFRSLLTNRIPSVIITIEQLFKC